MERFHWRGTIRSKPVSRCGLYILFGSGHQFRKRDADAVSEPLQVLRTRHTPALLHGDDSRTSHACSIGQLLLAEPSSLSSLHQVAHERQREWIGNRLGDSG